MIENMLTDEMRDKLEAHFETLMVNSEVYKRRAYEAALQFALEKRVPLEDEYFELICSISDEVVETDDDVSEQMSKMLTSMVFENERIFKAMFVEFMKRDQDQDQEPELN